MNPAVLRPCRVFLTFLQPGGYIRDWRTIVWYKLLPNNWIAQISRHQKQKRPCIRRLSACSNFLNSRLPKSSLSGKRGVGNLDAKIVMVAGDSNVAHGRSLLVSSFLYILSRYRFIACP